MFNVVTQTAIELVATTSGGGGGSLVEPAGGRFGAVLNQTTGVDTIFNLIQTLTQYAIMAVVALCVLWFVYGTYLLIRAAGNPQQLEKARNQMIFSGVAGALAVGAFLIIGTFLDVANDAAGGNLVDVGNVIVTGADQAGEVKQSGEPIGIYAGRAVRCTEAGMKSDGSDFSEPHYAAARKEWKWTAESDKTKPNYPGTCTRGTY